MCWINVTSSVAIVHQNLQLRPLPLRLTHLCVQRLMGKVLWTRSSEGWGFCDIIWILLCHVFLCYNKTHMVTLGPQRAKKQHRRCATKAVIRLESDNLIWQHWPGNLRKDNTKGKLYTNKQRNPQNNTQLKSKQVDYLIHLQQVNNCIGYLNNSLFKLSFCKVTCISVLW